VLVLLLAWLGKDSVEIRNVTVGLNFRDWGFLLLFVLFVLELADRVTMKRDLQIAREIQHWLLPEAPPRLPGLDISFTTRPANTVSGDYYDAFLPEPDGNRLLLVVADVAGKSVPAALLMASFQASLHAYAHDSDGPLSLARRLNQFACTRSLDGQRFTTAFLAQLDLKTRTIYYVNAGHNPPVLRRAGGEVERLEVGGLPFGIRHDETYEAGKTNLLAGDLLFVFTDGVIEAVNEEEQVFGEARLLEALSSLERESAEGTIRSLMARIDRFVGDTRQSDDITCLAMRVE
jgi:sigma-B regulation protein RsbU (phosphoserine phosphatase)